MDTKARIHLKEINFDFETKSLHLNLIVSPIEITICSKITVNCGWILKTHQALIT